MRKIPLIALGICFAAALSTWHGCGSDKGSNGTSAVRIDVLTDYAPGDEFDSVLVTAGTQNISIGVQRGEPWAPAVTVGSLSLENGSHTLHVSLLKAGAPTAARPVALDVSSTTTVAIALTRSCADVDCRGSAACHGGQCVDAHCTRSTPDACGPAQCTQPNDCPLPLGCLVNQCQASLCLQLPDDLKCGDDEHCDAASGCVGNTPTATSCEGRPMGTVCRPAGGACDVAEVCDGASALCPADTFLEAGRICRARTDACDVEEICTGASANCPLDNVAPANTPCGESPTQPCDRADFCDGVSKECSDAVQVYGIVCRERADIDVPLGTENCDRTEACDGISKECPPDAREPSTKICRAAVTELGATCDLQETCGGNNRCPADAKRAAGTKCRDAVAGVQCDIDDYCDGTSSRCVDARPIGQVCRASVGVCDAPETCGAGDVNCPVDLKYGSGQICRAAAGGCDIAEYCDGISNGCTAPDTLRPGGYVCRAPSGDEQCGTPAALCSGSSATCPSTSQVPSGTCCEDPTGSCASGYRGCSGGQCTGGCKGPSVCD